MKYFTANMWRGWQSQNNTVATRAFKTAEVNSTIYRKSLKTVARRLGVRAGRFFTHHSLHDGRLLSFDISDLVVVGKGFSRAPTVTNLEIVILAGTKIAEVYWLSYAGIEEISVSTKNNLFGLKDSRFGDWGYDELLPEHNNLLRHNILFQTGTEISIVFRKFSFKRKRATGYVLRQYLRSQANKSYGITKVSERSRPTCCAGRF